LNTTQIWTCCILFANILGQIYQQIYIGEELYSVIFCWVLLSLILLFTILSFAINKKYVKYGLIIMQVYLLASLLLHYQS